jgi:hypothetical protein
MLPGEPFGILRLQRGDPDLGKIAHQRQQPEVFAALDAGAHDGGDRRILARQRPHREGGGARRSDAGDVGAVHHAERCARGRVEERDESQVVGQVHREVALEDVDHLHHHGHAVHPGRHGEREAFPGNGDCRPRRHLHLARRQGLEAIGQRVEQRARLEQLDHVGLAQAQDAESSFRRLRRVLHESTSRSGEMPRLTISLSSRRKPLGDGHKSVLTLGRATGSPLPLWERGRVRGLVRQRETNLLRSRCAMRRLTRLFEFAAALA